MPFTVITLTNVPNSLRGELTKWMQEIAEGVYVGNFNSRVREQLWHRVCDNVKKGEATISYATRNEIGYTFDTFQTKQEVFELEGIPLVRYPLHQRKGIEPEKYGFSKAFQSHMYRKTESRKKITHSKQYNLSLAYVLMDLETTGLDHENNQIIEIGAVKITKESTEEFHRLLKLDSDLPEFITELTGITKSMLVDKGEDRKESLEAFAKFIGDLPLIGYNVKFDIRFLENEFNKYDLIWKNNKYVDIMALVKRERMFLDNYKLSNVLTSYGINTVVQHRALEDVKLLGQLISKLNEFEIELGKKADI